MTRTALALVAALGLAACGNPSTTQNTADTSLGNTAMAGDVGALPQPSTGATANLGTSAEEFVGRAAISDMYEIQSSKLALSRSQNADIRKFAQTMIDAHSATTAELKKIVASQNLAAPPAALDKEHQDEIDDLTKESATDFDKEYVDQQTTAHEQALALMQNYADKGENEALRAFAAQTAPKVQMHLDLVKALDKGGADGTGG